MIELSEFDVQYHPRTAIKAQVLADFAAEFIVKETKAISHLELWAPKDALLVIHQLQTMF